MLTWIAVFFVLLIVMIVQIFPLIEEIITNRSDESSVISYLDTLGWRMIPALVGLGALQVIVPIIPAPAIGILTGMSYGVLGGSGLYLLGVVLGNAFVFISIRQLSWLFTRHKKRDKEKKSKTLEKFEKIKRPEIVAFFLFLIPFLSGAGPYLFAQTHIRLKNYILAVTVGSIPLVLMYNYLGDHISSGNNLEVIIMGSILGVVAVGIAIFRKKIMQKLMGE